MIYPIWLLIYAIIAIFLLHMMTSSNGNMFYVTGPLCGEFTGHRWIPCTKASGAKLWCFLWSAPGMNKRLGKQLRDWWFETPSRILWRHCNELRYVSGNMHIIVACVARSCYTEHISGTLQQLMQDAYTMKTTHAFSYLWKIASAHKQKSHQWHKLLHLLHI